MEDKIVGFELAILASYKGFNEPSNSSYSLESKDLNGNPIKGGKLKKTIRAYRNTDFDVPKGAIFVSAPTQTLIQKWLREVHKINLLIKIGYGWEWYVDKEWSIGDGTYNTYEEALEDGLLQVLKSLVS